MRLFDGVAEDAPLGIKVEYEQAGEGLIGVDATPDPGQGVGNGADGAAAGGEVRLLALFAPADDELLGHGARAAGQECQRLRGHTLGEDLEADIANDGDAVPSNWRGPKGGAISDAAGDDGEMRVGGREEVEGDVGREDVVRERGLKEGRQSILEDS